MTTVPAAVLAAFAVTGEPRRLTGGKGGTWRAGDVVLKPAEGTAETRWRAGVLDALPDDPAFRVARPLRATDGDWIAHGWEAQRAVPGRADPHRADDVVRAGIAFHRAVAALPRPSFLDVRDDPWSYGDRLAFGEPWPRGDRPADGGVRSGGARSGGGRPADGGPRPPGDRPADGGSAGVGRRRPSALVDRLLAVRRPVTSPSQVVHGDLLGNVLFAPDTPPAIIDWPAYWRPPAWAYAVAVVDALCWHGAGPAAVDRWSHLPQWDQMLVRALIYRIGTVDAAGRPAEPEDAYRPVVALVVSRVQCPAPEGGR